MVSWVRRGRAAGTEALAPGRGHDIQRVAAVERRLDALALAWPEDLVADVCEQRVRFPRPLIDSLGAVGPFKSLESLESERRLCLSTCATWEAQGRPGTKHGAPGPSRPPGGTGEGQSDPV